MKAFKKLTGETAIYGLPSIIGRLLNWVLNPYWTYVFLNQADLGKITTVYSYLAFLFVFLTFGMETSYFRFAAKENKKDVFSTSFYSILAAVSIFLIALFTFKNEIAHAIELESIKGLIPIVGATLALDVLASIPFAKLRLKHRPVRFATIKMINIGINIFFNILFLSIIPGILKNNPDAWIGEWYRSDFSFGYVFLANLIASVITMIMLLPTMKLKLVFDRELLKKMVKYAFPILIVGITGMINMNIDKILIPILLPESSDPFTQLGIYAASFKLGVVLNMFTQAFRFAFEPFFFSQNNDVKDKQMYAIIMKYFTLFGLIIFLGLTTFIDLFKLIIAEQYRESIEILPIILMANLFMGIYFTLSLWYKLTDKTRYGAYIGILGASITLILNITLIPLIGYWGSAWAYFSCYVIMVVVSYLMGQKHYPIPYQLKSFLFYLFVALVLFGTYWMVRTDTNSYLWFSVIINVFFLSIIVIREKHELKRLFNF